MSAPSDRSDPAAAVARAVLYEGHNLHPRERAAIQSGRRWAPGSLFPRAWSRGVGRGDPCSLRIECLVRGWSDTELDVRIRFLHFARRLVGALPEPLETLPEPAGLTPAASLETGDMLLVPCEEAREREFQLAPATLGQLARKDTLETIALPASREVEPVRDRGRVIGAVIRETHALRGEISVHAEELHDGVWQLALSVENRTPLNGSDPPLRAEAQRVAFGSAHAVLAVEGGAFVSLSDPPAELHEAARACSSKGVWPVLLGAHGEADMLLASPVILPDHPQVALDRAEAPCADAAPAQATALRLLAMSDREEAAHAARRPAMAECAAAMPRAALRLASIRVGESTIAIGDRVRLKRRAGDDPIDAALAGMIAAVEAIEPGGENRVRLAVSIADDPEAEFATLAEQRFFYEFDEVELLQSAEAVA